MKRIIKPAIVWSVLLRVFAEDLDEIIEILDKITEIIRRLQALFDLF